jgi:hypothetical protein
MGISEDFIHKCMRHILVSCSKNKLLLSRVLDLFEKKQIKHDKVLLRFLSTFLEAVA